jgi:hypothetical protein
MKTVDKELMLQFGGLGIRRFVRLSRMNWIGHFNRMDRKNKVFNNNSPGSRLRGRPNADGGIVHLLILLNVKLETGKKNKKTELTGRSPLRRRRSVLDCSAI